MGEFYTGCCPLGVACLPSQEPLPVTTNCLSVCPYTGCLLPRRGSCIYCTSLSRECCLPSPHVQMLRSLFLSEPLHMDYLRWRPHWTDGLYLTGRGGTRWHLPPPRPRPGLVNERYFSPKAFSLEMPQPTCHCNAPHPPPGFRTAALCTARSSLCGLGSGTDSLGHLCLGLESVRAQNSCSELCYPFSSRPGPWRP